MKCPICGKLLTWNPTSVDCLCKIKDYTKEIERLKIQNTDLVKQVSMMEEYYGIQKSDYYDEGKWHKITEVESNQIKKRARIFHRNGKL